MVAPAPELLLAAADALHCWQWCGGWEPDRLPLYAAFYPVTDWALLLDLLQHIRQRLAAARNT